jgi:hypothetical protein
MSEVPPVKEVGQVSQSSFQNMQGSLTAPAFLMSEVPPVKEVGQVSQSSFQSMQRSLRAPAFPMSEVPPVKEVGEVGQSSFQNMQSSLTAPAFWMREGSPVKQVGEVTQSSFQNMQGSMSPTLSMREVIPVQQVAGVPYSSFQVGKIVQEPQVQSVQKIGEGQRVWEHITSSAEVRSGQKATEASPARRFQGMISVEVPSVQSVAEVWKVVQAPLVQRIQKMSERPSVQLQVMSSGEYPAARNTAALPQCFKMTETPLVQRIAEASPAQQMGQYTPRGLGFRLTQGEATA